MASEPLVERCVGITHGVDVPVWGRLGVIWKAAASSAVHTHAGGGAGGTECQGGSPPCSVFSRRNGKDWKVRGTAGWRHGRLAQELGQEKMSRVTSEDQPLDTLLVILPIALPVPVRWQGPPETF